MAVSGNIFTALDTIPDGPVTLMKDVTVSTDKTGAAVIRGTRVVRERVFQSGHFIFPDEDTLVRTADGLDRHLRDYEDIKVLEVSVIRTGRFFRRCRVSAERVTSLFEFRVKGPLVKSAGNVESQLGYYRKKKPGVYHAWVIPDGWYTRKEPPVTVTYITAGYTLRLPDKRKKS